MDELTHRPRMRPGEGITGSAAAARAPVMLSEQAHLDPRFKNFPNLPEDEYESILAVPILARGVRLEGALNVRTRVPRVFGDDEVELLLAIAAQVAQSIEHAKLYAEAQRRVRELEALARISEAVSESLYLEESLEAIVKTTMDALGATGAALVLDDGRIAWPEGVAGTHALRQPLRWRGRQIGELVADRETAFTEIDQELLASIATHAAVALEHGRAVLRGVLAQEIHHRVKNNLQTVASLLRLQARSSDAIDPREALEHSVNRILAIAAVHELLTEQREERRRPRRSDRPSARDARPGRRAAAKTSSPRSSRSRCRAPARRRWRSCSPSCCRTRSSTEASGSTSRWRAGRPGRPRDRRQRRRHRSRRAEGNRAVDRPGARARRAARNARGDFRCRDACRGALPGVRRPEEAFVFVRRGGEFLVLHRSPRQGAYWHGVAGALEAGETAGGRRGARIARGDNPRRRPRTRRASRTPIRSRRSRNGCPSTTRASRRSSSRRSSSTPRPAGSRRSTGSTTTTAGAHAEAAALFHWPEPAELLRRLIET